MRQSWIEIFGQLAILAALWALLGIAIKLFAQEDMPTGIHLIGDKAVSSDSTLTLAWDAYPDSVAVDGFVLYRSDRPWVLGFLAPVDTTAVDTVWGSTATQMVIARPDTSGYYALRAFKDTAASKASNVVYWTSDGEE